MAPIKNAGTRKSTKSSDGHIAPKMTKSKGFPAYTVTFKNAWNRLVNNIPQLLIIVAIGMIPFLLLLVGGAAFGAFVGLQALVSPNTFMEFAQNPDPTLIFGAITGVLAIVAGSLFLSVILRIAVIELFGTQTQKSARELIHDGLMMLIPFIVMSFLLLLLNIGALGLFFFPVFLFAFIYQFAPYELIFKKSGIIGSIKNSQKIVLQNFGEVFVRNLLFLLLIAAYYLVIGMGSGDSQTITTFEIWMGYLSIPLGMIWYGYGIAYSIELYFEAESVTDRSKKTNFTLMVILSIIGWLLFGTAVVTGVKLLSQLDLDNVATNVQKEMINDVELNMTPDEFSKLYEAETGQKIDPQILDQLFDENGKFIMPNEDEMEMMMKDQMEDVMERPQGRL